MDLPEPMRAMLEAVEKFKVSSKNVPQALLCGIKAHSQLLEVAELKSTLNPGGDVLLFADELLSPSMVVVLYERPRDLRHARLIFAQQIDIAMGSKGNR